MTSDSRIVERFAGRPTMAPSRPYPYLYFHSLWQNQSHTMTYRELQMMARMYNIPCNLKKSLLRLLIDAKLNGREEEIHYLLKQDKLDKLNRRIKRENDRRLMSELLVERQENEVKSERAPVVKVENIMHKILNDSSTRNVTICHTTMSAQLRAFEGVGSASSATAPRNCVNSLTDHQYTEINIDDRQKSNPQGVSQATCAMPNFHHYQGNMCETHTLQPVDRPKLYHPNKFSGCCSTNPPPYGVRNQHYCSFLKGFENAPPPTGLDEFLQLGNNRPVKSDLPGTSQSFIANQALSNGNNQYQPKLPSFNVFKNQTTKVDSEFSSKSARNPTPVGLLCLADMAMSMESDDKDRSFHNQLQHTTGSANHENYLLPDNSELNEKDVPTWKNYLEQIQSKVDSRGITCKYGCHFFLRSKSEQLQHESHCKIQPVECPMVACNWFNQLGSLASHVFNNHSVEVICSPQANFLVNIFEKAHNSNFCLPSGLQSGPDRSSFLQLVDHRLFVIFVILNLEMMQVMIYTQFVNDSADWAPEATLEVLRSDGILYSFKGRVYPFTYPSQHLITRHNCLVFNISPEKFPANSFTVHTTIGRLRMEM